MVKVGNTWKEKYFLWGSNPWPVSNLPLASKQLRGNVMHFPWHVSLPLQWNSGEILLPTEALSLICSSARL